MSADLSERIDLVELLRHVVPEVVSARLKLPHTTAELLAEEVCSRLQSQAGGRSCYLQAPSRARRDAQMRAAFDARRADLAVGENLQATAAQFDVSTCTVRRVCCG